MVCRTTPGGRVVTPHIRLTLGWDDTQCTSLYHRLRNKAITSDLSVSHQEYRDELESIRVETLGLGGITDAARARALMRIDAALQVAPPSRANAWATRYMRIQAHIAEAQIDILTSGVAEGLGLSHEFTREEFQRLRREAPSAASALPELPFPLPNDVATRYSLHTLTEMHRCQRCMRFMSLRYPESHACPSEAEQSTESDTITTIPVGSAIAEPEIFNMERFQEEYDRARERILNGETEIESFDPWNIETGEVTGGLSGTNGTTFGLEIEIDFPDEPYPYSARAELAERLYEEGLAISPSVMRWHFLGGAGEDRPGGEYDFSPSGWVCEFDRTVDDVEGERGVEIKSQILVDVPETWQNLAQICAIAREMGGRPTQRTGVHVNIGADEFPETDPAAHLNLLRLLESMDDTLIRLAHNPECGARHRGRNYCAPIQAPSSHLSDVSEVKRYAGHYHAINLGHLPDEYTERTESSRLEVRIFDSSLDLGRLQSQVAMSLALTRAAASGIMPGISAQPAGYARRVYGSRKLSGEQWEAATQPFRRFLAIMGKQGIGSEKHVRQMTHLFAESRWPHPV